MLCLCDPAESSAVKQAHPVFKAKAAAPIHLQRMSSPFVSFPSVMQNKRTQRIVSFLHR